MGELVAKKDVNEVGTFANTENFKELFDLGKMLASSQLVPDNYRGKPMDCTIALDMANRMNVSPMMVMQNLFVVRGKPSWSGQACMTLIQANSKFKNVRPIYSGEKGTDSWGCYIGAEYRDTGEVVHGPEVTIKMAKDEGWYSKKDKNGKETSKWPTMPELMLSYRAAAFFARVHIPNALMGVHVEGEAEDIQKPERVETTNPFAPDMDSPIMAEAEEIFDVID